MPLPPLLGTPFVRSFVAVPCEFCARTRCRDGVGASAMRFLPMVGLLSLPAAAAAVVPGVRVSRRAALTGAFSGSAAVLLPFAGASAAVPAAPADLPERAALLSAISSGAPDSVVLSKIEALVLLDPAKGRGAAERDDLSGEWELIWSYGAEAFSPLLTLPRPFRPDSYQYLGPIATIEVGEGRVGQGLVGGVLGPVQLWLSSGALVSGDDPSVLDIKPPFRLQAGGRAGSGATKRTIVEAGSDADFRKANVRTEEAQRAPPNKYKQTYLEGGGKGALRISTVTEGDPVIVGLIFIHRKVS